MSTLYTILTILYIIFALFFITIIVMQKKRSSGLGSIGGLSNDNNTMGRTTDDTLTRMTKICGVIFFAATILLSYVK